MPFAPAIPHVKLRKSTSAGRGNSSRRAIKSGRRDTIEDVTHLVQLLLPVYDNSGRAFPASHYAGVRDELTARFGGLTAYTRAPAEGLWTNAGDQSARDDIVVYEVMVDELDAAWWSGYRRTLEARFAQQELVVRAQDMRRL